MELRVRGDRAVLADGEREVDPGNLPLGTELTEALHEWARVAAALRRAETGRDEPGAAATVVSQRGRQLAGRLAAIVGAPVSYADPVTGTEFVVAPPAAEPRQAPRWLRVLGEHQGDREPTPWATGLTVAAFVGVVVLVAVAALAHALATETQGWIALVAAAVVSGGLAPSLWLGRRLPIVRWVVLGAASGLLLSWIPVLVIAL